MQTENQVLKKIDREFMIYQTMKGSTPKFLIVGGKIKDQLFYELAQHFISCKVKPTSLTYLDMRVVSVLANKDILEFGE